MRRILGIVVLMVFAAFTLYGTSEKRALPSPEPAASSTPSQSASAALPAPKPNIPEYEWYPVVRVVDGDTIVVRKNNADVTVRLIGLDTPETVDPRKPVQCFGTEASNEMKEILQGQSVRLEYDASQGTLDKYGRTLAYIYAPANSDPAGILVNSYMIREGYGHEYTYRLPYKYQADLKAAENFAREEKRGLWAPEACESTL